MSKKILIVEDESDIRAALVAWLEDEEYEVAESSNGIDGLAEFERFHLDLALLDMNLPGASGIDLCRRITPGLEETFTGGIQWGASATPRRSRDRDFPGV